MTRINYDVKSRPKKFSAGRTNIGWAAECGRDAVEVGGYLVTTRTPKGKTRMYAAIMLGAVSDVTGQDGVVETEIGTMFETRATAAFAIWRKYYEEWRIDRLVTALNNEAILKQKREDREHQRSCRQTPEGKKAYREDLNRKARERRANMTNEERVAEAAKRRAKREHKNTVTSYSD